MMNPDCHFGDHSWEDNGHCRSCDAFNGGWLQWKAVEKAQREGRHHGDHFHRTVEKAAACAHPTHNPDRCAEIGGCMDHEPSESYTAGLPA